MCSYFKPERIRGLAIDHNFQWSYPVMRGQSSCDAGKANEP